MLSDIASVFESIPEEAKSLIQFSPVIGLFRAKQALVRTGVKAAFSQSFVFSCGSVRVETHLYDVASLWLAAQRMHIAPDILKYLAGNVTDHILNQLLAHKSVHSCQSSETEWLVTFPSLPASNVASVSDAIVSLFVFLVQHVPLLAELVRICWIPFAPQLEKLFGVSSSLSELEQQLLNQQLLPADAPTRLISAWAKVQEDRDSHELVSALSDTRSRLLADVNRRTVHLRIPRSDLLKTTVVPTVVSAEAVRIANTYFATNPRIVSNVVSLFKALRHPSNVDAKATNARHAGIFFNDCVYLCLALALLPNSSFQPEIVLLRSAASKAVSAFLNRVAERAVGRLAGGFKGGLGEQKQVRDAEMAIQHCISEISECNVDWKSLSMDPSVVSMWNSVMLDAVMKEMIKIATDVARAAVSSSKSVKGLLSSSTSTVSSGLWSVFRKFTESVTALMQETDLAALLSWTVVARIALALSGSQTDIMGLEPWPADEGLYGLSSTGFETLLACNPLLQGESKETFKRLLAQFVAHGGEMSPHKAPQFPEDRNIAALFN